MEVKDSEVIIMQYIWNYSLRPQGLCNYSQG